MRNKFKRKNFLNTNIKDQGFSFIEFIIAVTLLGITSTIIVPIFKSSLNKSRQKEATLIVSSMIKSAKSIYGLYAFLPFEMGELKKFAEFKKCNANQVDINGRLACKNFKPVSVENDEVSFFSPSGNYKIEMSQIFLEEQGSMFLVKANPNGLFYKDEGSAVVGCYSPISGVSLVKEFSGKPYDRGEKSFITCGSGINIAQREIEEKKKKIEEEKKKKIEEEKKKKIEEEEKKKIEEEKKKKIEEEKKKKIEEKKKEKIEEKKKEKENIDNKPKVDKELQVVQSEQDGSIANQSNEGLMNNNKQIQVDFGNEEIGTFDLENKKIITKTFKKSASKKETENLIIVEENKSKIGETGDLIPPWFR